MYSNETYYFEQHLYVISRTFVKDEIKAVTTIPVGLKM
jgi:hypothetical protein